ncbi:hypothetical protein GQR58_022036 [Nymphon striatum]|nr:hypothetical protein GQR58_022036 [Nymphon striatum]
MSRDEMDDLGWDSCDIIIVTGDAYVDHPSFGMAIIGRLLESQGFRVGIISQPDWRSADDFCKLGKPNLFYGIAAGNMDSMVNHYTADRKPRFGRCLHCWCKSRVLVVVFPVSIPAFVKTLNTNHKPLTKLYRRARKIDGVKRIFIASGLRYDLAVTDPEYVKELVTHHVGGRLKIAPEHTEHSTLSKMMKPGIGSYYRFKELFEKYSKEAGKEQYLIPYFISSHPGTTDEDMLNLALWLKENNFKPDQVQGFIPTPMALASAMYHSEINPLKKVGEASEHIDSARDAKTRRLHKALLRYHDPENWQMIRAALKAHGTY